METTLSSFDDHPDDWQLSFLIDDEHQFPSSDEDYAHEVHLQEALFLSLQSNLTCQKEEHVDIRTASKSPAKKSKVMGESSRSLHDFPCKEEELDDIQSNSKRPAARKRKSKKAAKKSKVTVEYSRSFCDICVDAKLTEEMFSIKKCSHLFCKGCIAKYIGAKLQENISTVKCPDVNCKVRLKPQSCRDIIPIEVFDRWENALCESLILGSQKFFCPFKDCSGMLVDDGEETVKKSECPHCHRLFCAQCKVSWHSGMKCEEFQELEKESGEKKDDILMEKLAKKKKWRRCPNCEYYVAKRSGCLHITCRCSYEFCYGCGSKWSGIHACSSVRDYEQGM